VQSRAKKTINPTRTPNTRPGLEVLAGALWLSLCVDPNWYVEGVGVLLLRLVTASWGLRVEEAVRNSTGMAGTVVNNLYRRDRCMSAPVSYIPGKYSRDLIVVGKTVRA